MDFAPACTYHRYSVSVDCIEVLNLSGSLCAVATPFHGDDAGEIDFDAFARLIEYQVAGGTRGLVVAGSTGEAAALDEDEFARLLAFAVERVAARIPVIAGTGLQSTRKTLAQTRRARDCGCDAALVVVPPYVRATQEGLLRHFSEVADHGGLPVLLYNVPSRTACDLLPETVARLAGHGNVIGIKEAVADPARIAALLAFRDDGFRLLSGDDGSFADAMLAGADGVVSVAANVAPRHLAALAGACAGGRRAEAAMLDAALRDLYAVLGVEPNPIPLKWCLAKLGLGTSALRLPLVSLSSRHQAVAGDVLAALELFDAARAVG
jgi:4-hydroxy-tetrahydrodipicolinate synthase